VQTTTTMDLVSAAYVLSVAISLNHAPYQMNIGTRMGVLIGVLRIILIFQAAVQ
jgi:hypothetical protein